MSTSRIYQVWPTDLKERVREITGNGNITEYTIIAIEEKMARDALGFVPEPEPKEEHTVEDALAQIQAAGDVVSMIRREILKPASSVEKPTMPHCEKCGAPLVDGEDCWTCSL